MKKIKILLALLAITLVLSVCKSYNKKKNIDKQIIKIGAVLSLSGDGAEYGKDQQRAINLFIEQIERLNSKYLYQIIYQDSKSNPKDAVSALNNLISTEKPDVVISVLSSVCLSIKPITEKLNIPLFCVGANPQITNNAKLVFRSLPTSDYQAEVLANKFIDKTNLNSYSILYLNDDFGIGSYNSFKNVLHTNNKILLNSTALDPRKTDYKAEVTSVLKNKPDVIYIAAYGNSIAYVLKNLTEIGYKGIILSTLEVSYPNVLSLSKNTAENVYYVDTYYQDTINTKTDFVKAFKTKYNLRPTLDAVLAYDELSVIFKTFEKYDKLSQSFQKIKGLDSLYVSANGSFKINSKGDFLYPLVLKKISNGNPVIISK